MSKRLLINSTRPSQGSDWLLHATVYKLVLDANGWRVTAPRHVGEDAFVYLLIVFLEVTIIFSTVV